LASGIIFNIFPPFFDLFEQLLKC